MVWEQVSLGTLRKGAGRKALGRTGGVGGRNLSPLEGLVPSEVPRVSSAAQDQAEAKMQALDFPLCSSQTTFRVTLYW